MGCHQELGAVAEVRRQSWLVLVASALLGVHMVVAGPVRATVPRMQWFRVTPVAQWLRLGRPPPLRLPPHALLLE